MGGTAFSIIDKSLSSSKKYTEYRKGKLSIGSYQLYLESVCKSIHKELTEDQCHLSARFPINEEKMVDEILADLTNENVIYSSRYNKTAFLETRNNIQNNFFHNDKVTYIFPEEERLLYAITSILQPVNILFMGSYYGYWASWCALALQNSSNITVIDIDKTVIELSRFNISKLGLCNVKFVIDDAINYVSNNTTTYDLVVLDAEGPKKTGPIELRDKAIYCPMAMAVVPKINSNGLLISHNILFDNVSNSSYFEKKIIDNIEQLGNYREYMLSTSRVVKEYSTTEGVGVYLQ